LERFDGAIELVAFRDEKGDDMVSGHRSDGNKTLADRRRRCKRLCAIHRRLSGRTHLLSGKGRTRCALDPEGPSHRRSRSGPSESGLRSRSRSLPAFDRRVGATVNKSIRVEIRHARFAEPCAGKLVNKRNTVATSLSRPVGS
jgi:hypothetical protein